jgi:hypothetical protein
MEFFSSLCDLCGKRKKKTMKIFDFAGQLEFAATHQYLLSSSNTIYLLAFTITDPEAMKIQIEPRTRTLTSVWVLAFEPQVSSFSKERRNEMKHSVALLLVLSVFFGLALGSSRIHDIIQSHYDRYFQAQPPHIQESILRQTRSEDRKSLLTQGRCGHEHVLSNPANVPNIQKLQELRPTVQQYLKENKEVHQEYDKKILQKKKKTWKHSKNVHQHSLSAPSFIRTNRKRRRQSYHPISFLIEDDLITDGNDPRACYK